MAANLNDKIRKVGASTVTTLSAPGKALGAISLTVGSTTNYPTDTGIIIAIRQVDTSGELIAGTYTEWKALVSSGTSLTIDATPVYGSDQVYPAASTTQVYIPVSSFASNEQADAFLAEHSQTGTHGAITATSLSANTVSSDTISEQTAGAGVIVDGFAIKDSVPKNWNGWINPDETWTYVSASTFTVPGDQTAKYTKGTRLKWTQTTVKYGVVVSSAYTSLTTVTIAVNTDYTIANDAITNNYYSYMASPQGYPMFFTTSATEKISVTGNKMTKIGTNSISVSISTPGAATVVTYGSPFASILTVNVGCMASGSIGGNVAGKTASLCDQLGTSSFRAIIQTGDNTNIPIATYYFTWQAIGTI